MTPATARTRRRTKNAAEGVTVISYPAEHRLAEAIRITAPLAGLHLNRQQIQILARGCAKATTAPAPGRSPRPTPPGAPRPELNSSDWELLALVAQGLSNTELAWRLKVSHGAARQRVSVLMRRLGVENRVQAVAAGYELGLLPIAVERRVAS